MDALLTILVDTPWSRSDEDEADASGYDLAELQGFSADIGAGAAFKRMRADFDLNDALGKALQSQLTESLGVLGGQAGQVSRPAAVSCRFRNSLNMRAPISSQALPKPR